MICRAVRIPRRHPTPEVDGPMRPTASWQHKHYAGAPPVETARRQGRGLTARWSGYRESHQWPWQWAARCDRGPGCVAETPPRAAEHGSHEYAVVSLEGWSR